MSHKILLAWLLVLLFLVSPASSPSPVQARPSAVFTVNDTTDATDANPGDSICETAPGNGVCTLRAAIQETNALPGMDIIILPSGIYTLTIPGANEDNAATGDLDIRDDLTITGELSTTTIIDGNQLDRVFEILDPAKVSLSGMTIQNGKTLLNQKGAGVSNTGNLVADNMTIFNNQSSWSGPMGGTGAGIFSSGSITLTNSSIISNSAPYGGSALFTSNSTFLNNLLITQNLGTAIASQNVSLTLLNSTIENTKYGTGVGIGAVAAILDNVIIRNNYGFTVGGIDSWSGSVTLTHVIIDKNIGSAIWNHPGGQMVLYESTVSGNHPDNFYNNNGYIDNEGTIVFSHTLVMSNTAEQGGGLYNNGNAILTDSSFIGNNGNYGGAIWNSGFMTITRGRFESNNGNMNQGGAIVSGHRLVVSGTLFKNNIAGYGGAIYITGSLYDYVSRTEISNSLFISNTAEGGGAIGNAGILNLYNSSIIGNSAYAMGGFDNAGIANLDVVTLSNNSTTQIGAIGNNGALTMTHSLIANNTTTGDGGGISNYSSYAAATSSFTLENVTISNNAAPNGYGGGIFIGLPPYRAPINWLSLRNVTLSNNTALTGSNVALLTGTLQTHNSIIASGIGSSNCYFSSGTLTSLGHNLEDTNSCGLNATGDLTNTNPLLGPLQDNGGNTLTHALLFGSPAIDAGDNNGCPRTDQRGWLRPFGRACDIGAFELHYPFWLPLLLFTAP